MAEAESSNLWGPIAIASWPATPCTRGQVATEVDVKDGRAVFYLDLSAGQKSRPFDLVLPRCAILRSENDRDVPVIVIQIETSINSADEEKIFAGYRLLAGGNGVCLLNELELLNGPDDRFTREQNAN
jgi:hypothetical protein